MSCCLLALISSNSWAVSLNFLNKTLLIEQKEIPDTSVQAIHYTSVKLLEQLFNTKGWLDPERQTYTLKDIHDKKWVLVAGGHFFAIDQEIGHLPFMTFRNHSDFFFPTQELLKIINARYYLGLTFNPQTNQLNYDIGYGNIQKIFHRSKDNGLLVEVHTNEKLVYETLWVFPHFIINVQHGKLNKELLEPIEFYQGLVRKISTIQDTSGAQITLYIPHPIDTINTSIDPETNTLSIIIRKPIQSKNIQKLEAQADTKPKTQKVIVIDPGHGGKDPGASVKNIQEKAVTLYVAKLLQAELKKRNYKVLLTREKDDYISLKDRPAFAAKKGGDLFISLHCNAVGGTPKKQKSVSGFVAYILRAGQSKEDKALARRENQAIKESTQQSNKDLISPVDWILLEHELNLYSHQSEKFAEKIVKQFEGGHLQKHRTGAHQAGFFVLVGAFMPAVLFEMGFITHPDDRRYLSSKKGQKEIARRLANAIDDYFASVK